MDFSAAVKRGNDIKYEKERKILTLDLALSEKEEDSKQNAIEFLEWYWLNKYTDNNFSDELYDLFLTQKKKVNE